MLTFFLLPHISFFSFHSSFYSPPGFLLSRIILIFPSLRRHFFTSPPFYFSFLFSRMLISFDEYFSHFFFTIKNPLKICESVSWKKSRNVENFLCVLFSSLMFQNFFIFSILFFFFNLFI